MNIKRSRATEQRSRSRYGYKKRDEILEQYGFFRAHKTPEEKEKIRAAVDEKLALLKAKGLTAKDASYPLVCVCACICDTCMTDAMSSASAEAARKGKPCMCVRFVGH